MFYGPGNDSFRCGFVEITSDMALLYSVLWKVDGEYLSVTATAVNYTDFYLDQELANQMMDGSTVGLFLQLIISKRNYIVTL